MVKVIFDKIEENFDLLYIGPLMKNVDVIITNRYNKYDMKNMGEQGTEHRAWEDNKVQEEESIKTQFATPWPQYLDLSPYNNV